MHDLKSIALPLSTVLPRPPCLCAQPFELAAHARLEDIGTALVNLPWLQGPLPVDVLVATLRHAPVYIAADEMMKPAVRYHVQEYGLIQTGYHNDVIRHSQTQ
jgi:hypothetical protein